MMMPTPPTPRASYVSSSKFAVSVSIEALDVLRHDVLHAQLSLSAITAASWRLTAGSSPFALTATTTFFPMYDAFVAGERFWPS